MPFDELAALGYSVTLTRDIDAPNPYDAFEKMRTVHVPFSSVQERRLDGLAIDCADPWKKGEGFSERSLFVYLHSDEEIEKFLSGKERRVKPAEAMLAENCARQILALAASLKRMRNPAKAERARKDISAFADDLMLALGNPDKMSDVDEWLRFQMVPTAEIGYWLEGSPFLDASGRMRGASEIFLMAGRLEKFIQAPESGKAACLESLVPMLENSVLALDSFISLHKARFGGQLEFIAGMRKDFESSFGAGTAVEARWIYGGSGRQRARLASSCQKADQAVFLHARDCGEGDDASGIADFEASIMLDWLNGDVHRIEIVSPDGEIVESAGGFYGSDFDRNGLNDEIERLSEKIIRELSPHP